MSLVTHTHDLHSYSCPWYCSHPGYRVECVRVLKLDAHANKSCATHSHQQFHSPETVLQVEGGLAECYCPLIHSHLPIDK